MMSSTSDLGPVDPQIQIKGQLVAAKDIIAAASRATTAVEEAPNTFPIWASMLADITAVMVQQAHSAVNRSGELLREALASNPDRDEATVEALAKALTGPLIAGAQSHRAVFGMKEAQDAGLPILPMKPDEEQWQAVWGLWTRYFTAAGQGRIYESRRASQFIPFSS
jgi:hypothetical protein